MAKLPFVMDCRRDRRWHDGDVGSVAMPGIMVMRARRQVMGFPVAIALVGACSSRDRSLAFRTANSIDNLLIVHYGVAWRWGGRDRFSSGCLFPDWQELEHKDVMWELPRDYEPLVVYLPCSWLMGTGWKLAGTISARAVPGKRS